METFCADCTGYQILKVAFFNEAASGLVLIAKGRKGVDNLIIKSVKGRKERKEACGYDFFCWCIELDQLLLYSLITRSL